MRARKFLSLMLVLLLLPACTPNADDTVSPSPDGTVSPSEPPVSPDLPPSPPPSPSPPEPSPSPIETEEYNGPVLHAFFHFLIAFPEIGYSSDLKAGLDRDCITPSEFRRSLEEMYKNGYVLVDINDCIETLEDGTVVNKPIMVPVGKKPLILSFDDLCYDSRKLGKGICDKVILDEDGKLAMSTRQTDGTELITYDNDVVPMLEAFCEEYPDFSPFGAKGCLALTGFDGILGYRTQRDSTNRESEIEAVKPVIQALKDSGWTFASHSYGHIDMEKVDLERVKSDTLNWQNEVASLVGNTSVYIFAFGAYPRPHSDPRFQHILDSGFNIICGVGITRAGEPPYYKKYDTYAFMDRWFIDGNSLRNYPDRLAPLLDAETVYCPEERGGIPYTAPAMAGVVDDNGSIVSLEQIVTVALGGDVAMVSPLADRLRDGGADAIISPGLADYFRTADISIINLESAVSDIGEPWPEKDYTFRADPSLLDFLTETLGTDAVSIANNHAIDYGWDAFTDTLNRLKSYNIGYAGGGQNLAEAMTPYVMEKNGVSVAFIGACQHAPNMEWYAHEDKPGLLMVYDPALTVQAVKEAKELYDYVIVYIHWGIERDYNQSERQKTTAHKLIDAGADAVIGAHPHVVQGFEVYNEKPIAYSLGNFLMRNAQDNTAIVLLHLYRGEVQMEIVPCHVENRSYVSLAGDAQKQTLRTFWQSLSEGAVITGDWLLRSDP